MPRMSEEKRKVFEAVKAVVAKHRVPVVLLCQAREREVLEKFNYEIVLLGNVFEKTSERSLSFVWVKSREEKPEMSLTWRLGG